METFNFFWKVFWMKLADSSKRVDQLDLEIRSSNAWLVTLRNAKNSVNILELEFAISGMSGQMCASFFISRILRDVLFGC